MKDNKSLSHLYLNAGLVIPFVYFIISPNNRLTFSKYPSNINYGLNTKLFILFILFGSILIFINLSTKKIRSLLSNKINNRTSIILFNVFYFVFMFVPILLDYLFKLDLFRRINNFFRVSYISPIFADLDTILWGIQCKAVNEIGDLITCQGTELNMWNYPTVLLKLRHITNTEFKFLYGLILILVFMSIVNYLLIKNFWSADFLTLLVLISPPFLLAINRGNFDLIIAAFLLLAAVFISRQGFLFLAALLLFCTTVWLKFYSITIFLVLPLFLGRTKRFIVLIIGLLVFLSVKDDLSYLSKFLSTDSSGAVGLPVLISKLSGSLRAIFIFNWVAIFVLLISIALLYFAIRNSIPQLNLNAYDSLLFVVPGAIFVSTWLTTSSYYYRLILLSLVVIFIFKNSKTELEVKIALMGGAANYLSMQTFGILQNILILPIIVFWAVIVFKIIQARLKSVREKI